MLYGNGNLVSLHFQSPIRKSSSQTWKNLQLKECDPGAITRLGEPGKPMRVKESQKKKKSNKQKKSKGTKEVAFELKQWNQQSWKLQRNCVSGGWSAVSPSRTHQQLPLGSPPRGSLSYFSLDVLWDSLVWKAAAEHFKEKPNPHSNKQPCIKDMLIHF